jgi:virginiamycin A acetyltransferase
MLSISDRAHISPQADIEDSVRGSNITIEEEVVIDAFVKIKPVGGIGDIFIAKGSRLNSGTVLYSGNGIRIGRGVLIAANCTLAPVNHEYGDRGRPIVSQGFAPSKGGIVIEDDVWVGAGSVILDGAVLRRGCVVGALSLVTGELEAYGVYGGNPIRRLGERA